MILSVSLCQSALKTLSCGNQAVNNCAANADRYSLYRIRFLTGALWDRPSAPMSKLGRLVAHGLRSAHDALIDMTELSRPSPALVSLPPGPSRDTREPSQVIVLLQRRSRDQRMPRGDRTSRPRRSSMQRRVLSESPTRRGEAPCVEEHEASSLPLPMARTHTIAGARPRVCRSGS